MLSVACTSVGNTGWREGMAGVGNTTSKCLKVFSRWKYCDNGVNNDKSQKWWPNDAHKHLHFEVY